MVFATQRFVPFSTYGVFLGIKTPYVYSTSEINLFFSMDFHKNVITIGFRTQIDTSKKRVSTRKRAGNFKMEHEKKIMEEKNTNLPEKTKAEIQQERIENVLSAIRPGYSIAVYRQQPAWASGYLERIECLDDQAIDLDYLAETWGGEVLRIRLCDETGTYRGGADIPFRSYPVLFRGKRLKRRGIHEDDLPEGAQLAAQLPAPAAPAPQQPSFSIDNLLKLVSKTSTENLETLRELVQSTQTDVPVLQGSLANTIETIRQVKELQGILGTTDKAIEQPSNDMALFQTLGEVAKGIFSSNQQPHPPRRVIAPPPPQLQQHAPPPQPKFAPPGPLPGSKIAETLAGMRPDEAADVAFAAMSRMNDQQKEEMISNFLGRLGGESELDSEYDDDTDPEYDTDSEVDETPDQG